LGSSECKLPAFMLLRSPTVFYLIFPALSLPLPQTFFSSFHPLGEIRDEWTPIFLIFFSFLFLLSHLVRCAAASDSLRPGFPNFRTTGAQGINAYATNMKMHLESVTDGNGITCECCFHWSRGLYESQCLCILLLRSVGGLL